MNVSTDSHQLHTFDLYGKSEAINGFEALECEVIVVLFNFSNNECHDQILRNSLQP